MTKTSRSYQLQVHWQTFNYLCFRFNLIANGQAVKFQNKSFARERKSDLSFISHDISLSLDKITNLQSISFFNYFFLIFKYFCFQFKLIKQRLLPECRSLKMSKFFFLPIFSALGLSSYRKKRFFFARGFAIFDMSVCFNYSYANYFQITTF